MERIEIRNLNESYKELGGSEVQICGWIRTIRDNKTFGFIEINDGSFFKNLQVVFDDSLVNFSEIAHLNIGSAIRVIGNIVETPQAKQSYEIKASQIIIEGKSAPEYPLQKKRHTFEYLRTIAHLRPRTNTFSAVFRVRSVLSYAIHRFFQEKNFVYVHTPIITSSDSEGAGEMFQVTTLNINDPAKGKDGAVDYSQDFFGKHTSLTVSGQLAVEPYAMAFGKVYTFGPTFRAENSNTTRHAAEFWMIEPEIAFADLDDDMKLAEEMIKYIINYVMQNAKEEMDFFNSIIDKGLYQRLDSILKSEFGCITYTEAIDILSKSGHRFQYPVKWGADLQTEHERYLTEKIIGKPVFVINYPKDIKAFYMKINDDGKTVAAMDLLVPGVGEIIGGSQREERLDVLERRMEQLKLDKSEYDWYLDTRRFGTAKHAGFGLGFERMLMYMTGMQNIRDVLPYPRTVNNAEF